MTGQYFQESFWWCLVVILDKKLEFVEEVVRDLVLVFDLIESVDLGLVGWSAIGVVVDDVGHIADRKGIEKYSYEHQYAAKHHLLNIESMDVSIPHRYDSLSHPVKTSHINLKVTLLYILYTTLRCRKICQPRVYRISPSLQIPHACE